MERLKDLPKQLLQQWQRLTTRARIIVGASTALVLGLGVLIAVLASHVDYAPLYSRLDTADAGAVSEKLRELRVPFRAVGQDTIEVPRERVAEVRLQLAAAGLPQGGAAGFELFDRQSFGASEHTQRVNFQRALSGELERSITTLAAVRRARVHLAIPERTLFANADQQPSAAVLLQLHPGRSLAPDQVQGIAFLVASSVEGLSAERVTVIDQHNRLLSRRGEEEGQSAALRYQREVEKTLSQRAQELLERTVGKGRAAVQVARGDVVASRSVVARTATEIAAKAQLQIGMCRMEQKRYLDAVNAFLVIPTTYDYPELRAAALYEAGLAYLELNQREQANRQFDRVLREFAGTPWADAAKEKLGGK